MNIVRYRGIWVFSLLTIASACVLAILAQTPSATMSASSVLSESKQNKLNGVWLFDSVSQRNKGFSYRFREYKVTINGNDFELSHDTDSTKTIAGKLRWDTNQPSNIQIDLSKFLLPNGVQVKARTLNGTCDFDRDTIELHLALFEHSELISDEVKQAETLDLRLRRVGKDFRNIPNPLLIEVTDEHGHPVEQAAIEKKVTLGLQAGTPPIVRTDGTGHARVQLDSLDTERLIITSPQYKSMAIVRLSAQHFVDRKLSAQLKPCRNIVGIVKKCSPNSFFAIVSDHSTITNCYPTPQFRMPILPGDYTLLLMDNGKKSGQVEIRVPEGVDDLDLGEIDIPCTPLNGFVGQKAPELTGVMDWIGTPQRLSDLRGKFVLLDFWGYWCGPCVEEMPELIEFHNRHASRVCVIAVHEDKGGEVSDAATWEEKIAPIRAKRWNGQSLPFSVALTSGDRLLRRMGLSDRFDIRLYPTKVLIAPNGQVLGSFPNYDDSRSVWEQLEAALDSTQ